MVKAVYFIAGLLVGVAIALFLVREREYSTTIISRYSAITHAHSALYDLQNHDLESAIVKLASQNAHDTTVLLNTPTPRPLLFSSDLKAKLLLALADQCGKFPVPYTHIVTNEPWFTDDVRLILLPGK